MAVVERDGCEVAGRRNVEAEIALARMNVLLPAVHEITLGGGSAIIETELFVLSTILRVDAPLRAVDA